MTAAEMEALVAAIVRRETMTPAEIREEVRRTAREEIAHSVTPTYRQTAQSLRAMVAKLDAIEESLTTVRLRSTEMTGDVARAKDRTGEIATSTAALRSEVKALETRLAEAREAQSGMSAKLAGLVALVSTLPAGIVSLIVHWLSK